MNVTNVFGKKISLDYQTRPAPVMYPISAEFESVADTKPLLSNSSISSDSMKAPISGIYHSCNSLSGFYRSSPDELPPYFSSQNEIDFQPKVFHKPLRSCHSFDGLSETSTSSHDFDFQGNGWSKLNYPSLSYARNSYANKKNLFRPIKSRVTSPFLSESSILWTDEENSKDSVELVVSNLDYNISSREWKEILFSTFRSAVMVTNVAVKTQADNSNLGFVRVPTIEDARFAISQFHRKKIGYKRIHVSLKTEECQNNLSHLRNEVISLLKEAKGYVLPLFKFIEQFDRRYHRSITVSELYKMKDILEIREQGGAGRMIHLTALYSISPSKSDAEIKDVHDPPICMAHCPEDGPEITDTLDYHILPNVHLKLNTLTPQVHTMLQKHNGNLPLMSFPVCYAAEFKPLTITENGVNLEHLISCVSGIKIVTSQNGVKRIQWEDVPSTSPGSPDVNDRSHLNVTSVSSGSNLTQQLCQISREVVDLLKHSPQCRMPFSKFIPTYHHHFGRQCRVADYGYTKLIELFEAIPHVLQILGTGEKKMLTLSHRAQIRRFTSDLLRVLKVQTNKIITLSELPLAYSKITEKQWNITDYGICDIEDILSEISSGTIQVSEDPDPVLSIPRREQTPAEIARTKQFSREVVDLLKHNPLCEMTFNKFIPSYHHHFGRQCKVADYGFIKLIELFEAIPHVVEIDEEGEERMLRLTKPERLRIFSANIYNLLKASPDQMLLLSKLEDTFNQLYDSPFDFGTLSAQEILSMLQYQFQVEVHGGQKFVVMKTTSNHCPSLAQQIVPILMDHCSTGSVLMSLKDLCAEYKENYDEELDCSELMQQLFEYVQVFENGELATVSLSPLQEFALCVKSLLMSHGNIPFLNFESIFHEHYGIEVKPALYNFPNVSSMLYSISNVAVIRGEVNKQIVLVEEMNENSYNDETLLSSHLQETPLLLPEKFEPMNQDNFKVLQTSEDEQIEPQLWSTKTKLKKTPLSRTLNIAEIPLSKSQTQSDTQLTYCTTNTQQHFKPVSLNGYNGIDSCREGWSVLHPQLTRTNHWHNGHLGQIDPMMTQNQMRLNNGMASYPTGYWQPAYPTPHPQAYSNQSNLCQAMQNLHIAFTSVPMNLNSQYPSNESLHYQPVHSNERDFMHGHLSYESLFNDTNPIGTSSLVSSPKKMESQKSPKRSRLAAKFNPSTD